MRARLAFILSALVVATMLPVRLPAQTTLPGGHFLDDNGTTHEANIEAIAVAGITTGCNPEGTTYCPDDELNRAQMATLLTGALELAPAEPSFTDVTDGNVHRESIGALAASGITTGCAEGPDFFCPWDPVTRAQMASFLARALDLDPSSAFSFDDVAESGGHGPAITAIAAAGITLGCNAEGTLFCPQETVTRAQMASFLARALGLDPIDVGVRIDLLPPQVTCENTPRECIAALSVSSDSGFYVLEGFFYQLPYLEGDATSFTEAEFRLFIDGFPISGLVEHPTTTFGTTRFRMGGVTFPSLAAGSYDVVAEWWWEGELLLTSDIELTVTG